MEFSATRKQAVEQSPQEEDKDEIMILKISYLSLKN